MYQYSHSIRGHYPYFPSDFWEYYVEQGPEGYRVLDVPYLHSIPEKDEDKYKSNDVQLWTKNQKRMSEQSSTLHSNDSSGFGGSLSPGSSSVQASDGQSTHSTMYGSVPDVSTSGLHGKKEEIQTYPLESQSDLSSAVDRATVPSQDVIVSGSLEPSKPVSESSISDLEPLLASTPTKDDKFDFDKKDKQDVDQSETRLSKDGRRVSLTKMMHDSKTFQPIRNSETVVDAEKKDQNDSTDNKTSREDNSCLSVPSYGESGKDSQETETLNKGESYQKEEKTWMVSKGDKSVEHIDNRSMEEENAQQSGHTTVNNAQSKSSKEGKGDNLVCTEPQSGSYVFTDDYMFMQLGTASKLSNTESASSMCGKMVSFSHVESITSTGRVMSEVLKNEDIDVENAEIHDENDLESGQTEYFGDVPAYQTKAQNRNEEVNPAGISDKKESHLYDTSGTLGKEEKRMQEEVTPGHSEGQDKQVQGQDIAGFKGHSMHEPGEQKRMTGEESVGFKYKEVTTGDEDVPLEVPEELKSYIDPDCSEWKDPNTRKLIYKFAVRRYQRETGTPLEQSGSKPKSKSKLLLGPKDSMQGIIPSQILKDKQKQKLSEVLTSTPGDGAGQALSKSSSKPETGFLHPVKKMKDEPEKMESEDDKDKSSEEFPVKIDPESLKIQKEVSHYSEKTPGYGQFSFTSPSSMVTKLVKDDGGETESHQFDKDSVSEEIEGEIISKRPEDVVEQKSKHKTEKELDKYSEPVSTQLENIDIASGQVAFTQKRGGMDTEMIDTKGDPLAEVATQMETARDESHAPSSQLSLKNEQNTDDNSDDNSAGPREYSYTTPSSDSDGSNVEAIVKRSASNIVKYGYGDVDFTSASETLKHLQVLDTETESVQSEINTGQADENGQKQVALGSGMKHEQIMSSDEPSLVMKRCFSENCDCNSTSSSQTCTAELGRSTPSRLLRKVMDREITNEAGKSPGYGEFSFTSPSQLGKYHEELDPTDIDRSTPSKVLQKQVDREKTDAAGKSPGYAVFSFTSPSKLIFCADEDPGKTGAVERTEVNTTQKKKELNETDTTQTKTQIKMYHLGQPDLFEYVTSSQLLRKRECREMTDAKARSPGYGEFSFTSPSQLIERKTTSVEHGLGNMEYSTPSALLKKREHREKTEDAARSPGYGEFSFTSPSQLMEKKELPAEQGLGNMEYTTPSALLKKREHLEKTEDAARSPGYGEFSFTSPSQLMEKKELPAEQGLGNMEYTTPSALLKKREHREKTEDAARSPGYGEFSFTSPSQLIERIKTSAEQGLGNMEYTTPSALLKKREHRGKTDDAAKSPGYGEFSFTSPSQLMEKKELPAEQGLGNMEHTTPSVLLKKREHRKKTDDAAKSPGYGEFSFTSPSQLIRMEKQSSECIDLPHGYTTPSQLLLKRKGREETDDAARSPGYGEFSFTSPSELTASDTQRTRENSGSVSEPDRQERELKSVGTGESSNVHKARTSGVNSSIDQLQEIKGKDLDWRVNSDLTTYFVNIANAVTSDQASTHQIISQPMLGQWRWGFNHDTTAGDVSGRSLNRDDTEEVTNRPEHTDVSDDEQDDLVLTCMSKDRGTGQLSTHVMSTRKEDFNLGSNLSLTDWKCIQEGVEGKSTQGTSFGQGTRGSVESTGSAPGTWFLNWKSPDDTEEVKPRADDKSYLTITQDTQGRKRSGNTSSGYPLTEVSSRSVGSSLRITSNPSVQYISTDEDEEKGYDCDVSDDDTESKEVMTAKDRNCTSAKQKFPEKNVSKAHKEAENSPMELEQDNDREALPQKLASINELFWSLYSKNPQLIQDSLQSLASDSTASAALHNVLSQLSTSSLHAAQTSCSTDTNKALPPQGRQLDNNNLSVCSPRPQKAHTLPATPAHAKSTPKANAGSTPKAIVVLGQQNQKKRHLPHTGGRSMTPEARSWMMEKDVLESQNRKLQNEVSSLQTANNALKEKYSRATAKIANLEEALAETKEELESVHSKMQQEISVIQHKNKSEFSSDMNQLNSRVASLTRENEELKGEISSLEKQLDNAEKAADSARFNSEKSKAIEAFKMEAVSLKEEVNKVKTLLQQSEQHLHEEESRNRQQGQQILKLMEMKNLLQQQLETGGGTTVSDKQLKSLDKRLRITEERLHQERADRANNLSEVEDKLLTENARLQAVEKELNRQLQREKDKNRNLDNKIRDVREENEKLRLALPFDESSLTTQKAYDIPYSVHTSQRLDSVKTPDYKHVMSQVEQQSGLSQEREVVCHLWSTREGTYHQLRQLELILQDLNLSDNNVTEGLKNLRDVKSQYDAKLKQAEEKLDDAKAEKSTFETTYKEQLSVLVKERHDAFARLKTSEDLLEATRAENEILKKNTMLGATSGTVPPSGQGQVDVLTIQVKDLENQVQQLTRANKLLEGEVSTLRVRLTAKEKALEDAHSEIDKANVKLDNNEAVERKQQKIDKLTLEVKSLKAEVQLMIGQNNSLNADKKRLEYELESSQRDLTLAKMRQKESKAGEVADHKIVESLRDDLDEKNRKIGQLTLELQNSESQLQQNRHELLSEQSKIGNIEAEIESLQRQIDQRGTILDTVSASENEHTAQFKILKDTLDSVSQELNQKRVENEVLQVELSREKDRTEMLEKDVADMKELQDDSVAPREVTNDQLQVKELQYERDQLKEKLIQATTSLEKMTYDTTAVQKENKQQQEELAEEKSKLLQVSTEKGELEQHLEEIAEEHDAIIQEKTQVEEDLVKLENKLQEILQAVEMEARKQHDNFETMYSDIPSQARKIAIELDSMRTLLGAKNKEVQMMQDKLNRQNMEMEFLQRRIELLHNENQCNRDDISRLTATLAMKMKDAVSIREMNQFLSTERGKLQKEKENYEKELNLERNLKERSKTDMTSVIHKLESELTTSTRKGQDEITTKSHKLEMLTQEHQMLLDNLSVEKQAAEEVKADLRIQQSECERLRQEVHALTMDLESCQKQLTTSQEMAEDLKEDKDTLYKEYDSMFRKLGEKDKKIRELQEKCDTTVENLRKEFTLQQHNLQEEKTSTERDLDKSKEEVNLLNEDIKQKDIQLMTFGKTLQELEDVRRQKQELEREIEKLESTSGDVKLLLESHRKEISMQQDTISRMQDIQAELQLEKSKLAEQLKQEKESTSVQIHHLNTTITGLKNHNEGEKIYLKDNLSQTQTRLQSLESSLASAVESRDKLQINNRLMERSLEETKEQLQEETTSRKVSEQRADTLQSQLNESRKDRFLTEEKLNQTQATLTKTEKDLRAEKDKCNRLTEQVQELDAKSYSLESTGKAKQEQNDVLQSEVNKLKQIVENQKQQLGGRLKKSTQEFKQQIDIMESERSKLEQQIQKLQEDLELARETTLNKNKEILKLQENILGLEDQVRERSSKLRQVEDTLRVEEEIQTQLSSKYQAQEEEMKRLKNFLSKKAEEAGETDKSMWQDMNRVIQEMSRQIQVHFDSQKNVEKGNKGQDAKLLKRYKKQVIDLETDLNTEKALHQITKTSLQALEEDCQRLRQQYSAMKRRDKSSTEKKSKNRMEAINEIIARSQTHAQAMLAAGGYFDETLRSLTTPRGGDNALDSPDTSIASDFSFNSVGPAIIPTYTTTPSLTKTPRKY